LIFGATVLLVKGTYDEAFDLCLRASNEFGWYCRNTGYNPYTAEGKKTAALEICEQLTPTLSSLPRSDGGGIEGGGGWRAPDRIFVSVGDRNILSGLWKGLRDLLALGWIDKMPKLMGVQAEGSAACYNTWRAGTDHIAPIDAHTLADSINVGLPRDGRRAVRAVRESGGEFVIVSDQEILEAMRELARGAAVFAEPAGAAGYTGLVRAVRERKIDPDETVVVVVTGNGLKDVASAMRAAGTAHVIEPNLEGLRETLKGSVVNV
jgi:threonine synthase